MHNSSATQQVSFLGQIPYADVPRMIQSHDVFLLASDYEGLPLSLLEAMGCGLVPVVSDLESGVREIVDSTNGILVPMLDVAGYARAIIYLHKHRDELAAKSKAARERVQTEFSVAAMTDRWLAALSVSNSPIVEWPKSWKITAPLTAVNPVQFSGALRALRRIRARMRN
jgi:glycosyltransferase involved in cell wall biosynthesis